MVLDDSGQTLQLVMPDLPSHLILGCGRRESGGGGRSTKTHALGLPGEFSSGARTTRNNKR